MLLGDGSVQDPSSSFTVRKPRLSGRQAAALSIVKTRKEIQVPVLLVVVRQGIACIGEWTRQGEAGAGNAGRNKNNMGEE